MSAAPERERTLAALKVTKAELGRGSAIPIKIVADNAAVVAACADSMRAEYRAAKAAGRAKVVFIVPIGPVGPLERLAAACNRDGFGLNDLVVINMDEYLDDAGRGFISAADALSFRGYMERRFWRVLDPKLAPPPEQRIFPDPADLAAVPRAIARWGGVDVCYGGVGVTGHLAFNDPPEPDQRISVAEFAALPTRVVTLSRETLLINAVNAARGNVDRIPRLAVTVGMQEILASRKVRIYMNRPWQCAIVRKILHGPVTPAVPASLLQRHPDALFTIAEYVAELPEPELR